MRLRVLRSAWGLRGLRSADPGRVLAEHVGAAGFDGLEASLDDIGGDRDERRRFCAAVARAEIPLILSAYSSWPNYAGAYDARRTVREHSSALIAELSEVAELAAAHPSAVLRVNGHSGTDAWSEAQALDFFGEVEEGARALGEALPPVSHETHRGRYLCCPFATARLLRAMPRLRLTSDFSHWVVKCERLLDTAEEDEFLSGKIAPAVDHIHARIGTPQAPQVGDVSDPAVRAAAERHYRWWATVWQTRSDASISSRDATPTATLEYGPPELDGAGQCVGYAPMRAPHAGHEDVLRSGAAALREAFDEWHARPPPGYW